MIQITIKKLTLMILQIFLIVYNFLKMIKNLISINSILNKKISDLKVLKSQKQIINFLV